MKTELLTQIDGMAGAGQRVLVLAATNFPWCDAGAGAERGARPRRQLAQQQRSPSPNTSPPVNRAIDEALRRRLEKRVYCPLPGFPERVQLLRLKLQAGRPGSGGRLGWLVGAGGAPPPRLRSRQQRPAPPPAVHQRSPAIPAAPTWLPPPSCPRRALRWGQASTWKTLLAAPRATGTLKRGGSAGPRALELADLQRAFPCAPTNSPALPSLHCLPSPPALPSGDDIANLVAEAGRTTARRVRQAALAGRDAFAMSSAEQVGRRGRAGGQGL